MSVAFLFPGQGAQHVGMGQELCRAHSEAAACFEQAEAITGLPLRRLCFEGPEDDLDRTDISQPAIFTMSVAVLRVVEMMTGDAMPAADVAAGLSLGEYTALHAAGAINFETGVDLVYKRGQTMQAAAEATDGGMLCLLGADEAVAEAVCEKAAGAGWIQPANFNCPGQIVLSGEIAACRVAAEVADGCGASGVMELKVAGAFHSPLMQSAADRLAEVLAAADIRPPAVPVLSNVKGEPHDADADAIRRRLLDQLTHPVLWQRNCEYLLGAGVETFLEMGPGRVLAGLMRRINRRTRVTSLNGLAAVEACANG
ncbi:MAG: ACP S-malonyltransferase [Planctomycetota bacterium]